MKTRGTDDLEQAFIAYIADAAGDMGQPARSKEVAAQSAKPIEADVQPVAPASSRGSSFSLGRLLAYTNREAMEILSRPRAARLRFRWLGDPDVRLRLWHHHGCRGHQVRLA